MEGRKLLDAHVFNGRQEIAKPVVTNIAVLWISEIFVSFHSFIHTWNYKPHIVQQISVAKKTNNLTGKERWNLRRKRENYFLYVTSLTYIFY